MEEYFNDFMKLVKYQTKIENIIRSKKNWVSKNSDYFKNYYKNNSKDNIIECKFCNKIYNITHKTRHEKTEKHKKNLLNFNS